MLIMGHASKKQSLHLSNTRKDIFYLFLGSFLVTRSQRPWLLNHQDLIREVSRYGPKRADWMIGLWWL